MKKISLLALSVLSISFLFAQSSTNKIILTQGQKIVVDNKMDMETTVMGMQMTNTTSSKNLLTVNAIAEKSYTISSSTTQMKMTMDGMGQNVNYDSDKKEDANSEIGKSMGEKINKITEVLLDNTTGKATSNKPATKSEDATNANPFQSILNGATANADDAIVASAFTLIPIGKKIGDSWTDSVNTKEAKGVTIYTLKSITNNEANIAVDINLNANTTVEAQGQEMQIQMTTKTKGEIIADTKTAQTKKKTTTSDITGTMQMMGQDMPITMKLTTSSIFQ